MSRLDFLRPLRRAPFVLFLLAAGLTCRDDGATGPGLPGRGALDVTPVFETISQGGPLITLSRVRALLIGDSREGKDTASAEASFEGDSAVLRFVVTVAAPSQLFFLEVEALDAGETVIFRGTDTVRVAPGATAARGAPVLRYVAPDTAVKSLILAPFDTVLDAGDSVQVTALGLAADETSISTLHLGWLSRDPLAAAVSARGVVTAMELERETWVVARTFTGVTDSMRVKVRGGVASVAVSPDSTATFVGNVVAMYAEALDASGTPLSGDGREVTWTTLDPQIVSLGPLGDPVFSVSASVAEASGQPMGDSAVLSAASSGPPATMSAVIGSNGIASTAVTGLAPGLARIVAAVGTRADTAYVRVENNAGIVERTEVRPDSDTLTSLGDTIQLLAASYDALGDLAAGAYTWSARDPTIAGVSPLGTVVALAPGETWVIVAEAGGTMDSALVVVDQRVASVSITPFSAQVRLGSTIDFEASPVDGRGNFLASSSPIAWGTESQVRAQIDETGAATGTGVGQETVFASIDGVVGRALLSVVSPVARVVITPDTVTLGALGVSSVWTATAYDSAGVPVVAPMIWEISNSAVADLAGVDGATATLASAANGTAQLRATALGVQGAATVRVQQQLAAITLSPDPISIGVGGAAQLTPHALDANGFVIAGFPKGAYAWSVAQSTIASADQGFVVGLTLGTTTVSVRADAISSPAATVDVTDAAPAAISFARDTIPVGYSDSVDVPIFLSRPNPLGPVDVHLSVSDPAVSVEPKSVRFDPSSTSRIVRVRGHTAGSAVLVAVDSLTGYGSASAVIAAQPGVSFDPSVIAINATDEIGVRVLLTEPAPAGGMALQFNDGGTGIVAVSPHPVVIPAGHLAAEVTLRGLRAGETALEPVAPGVRGIAAQVVVADAVLSFTREHPDSGCTQCEALEASFPDATSTIIATDEVIVGAGQYLSGGYREDAFREALGVRTPWPMHRPLSVAIRADDPTVVQGDDIVVIGTENTTAHLGLGGLRPGKVTLTASAPGWTDATQLVIVTTPRLAVCCEHERFAGQADYLSVSVTDSLGVEHPRISSLVVRVSSSDPSVVAVLDSVPVIAIDESSNWSVRFEARGPGTAWVRATAGGHRADSVRVRVVGGSFDLIAAPTIGEEQQNDQAASISLPSVTQVDRTFMLTSSAPGVLKVPASVTIPAGAAHAYVPIEGISPGTATLKASTPEMESKDQVVIVTSPKVVIAVDGDTIPVNGTRSVWVYTADSLGNQHTTTSRVVVRIRPRDEDVLAAEPDSVMIEAGASFAGGSVRGLLPGSTRVRAQASSYLDDSTGTLTVVGSRLLVNDGQRERTIGAGQRRITLDYVRLAEPQATDVQIRFEGARGTAVPATVTIPAGETWAEIPVSGTAPGVDTIIVSGVGYDPDTLFYTVTVPHLIDGQTLPSTVPFGSPSYEVRVRPGDGAGETHASDVGVSVRVSSSNPNVLAVDSAWIHIPAGGSISTPVQASFVGPGVAALIFEDSAGVHVSDTSVAVAVTAPPLSLGQATVAVGMRQQTEDYDQWVSLPVAPTVPVTVFLSTSDARVAGVAASVVVPAGETMATFRITGGDATGTVQLRAVADGYHPASALIEVGRPGFVIYGSTWRYTVDAPEPVTINTTDHRGNLRTVTEDVIVQLESSNPAAAKLDRDTVTILAGTNASGLDGNGASLLAAGVGTTLLSASDARTTPVAYRRAESDTIEVRRPDISLGYSELVLGVGQYANNDLWLAATVDSARTVKLLRSNADVAAAPDTVQIPARESYAPLRVTGSAAGVDTMIAVMPGYVADSTIIRVDLGTIQLATDQGLPLAALKLGQTVMVRLLVLGPDGNHGGPVAAATIWQLTAGPGLTLSADAGGQTPIDRITVPVDQTISPWFYVGATSAGTPTISISNPSYRTLDRMVRIDP